MVYTEIALLHIEMDLVGDSSILSVLGLKVLLSLADLIIIWMQPTQKAENYKD